MLLTPAVNVWSCMIKMSSYLEVYFKEGAKAALTDMSFIASTAGSALLVRRVGR